MACVLFMDIVAFTQLNPSAQLEARQTLEKCVRSTETFKQAMQDRVLLARPAGDGFALVFFSHPCIAAKCAVEVAKLLQSTSLFRIRMGINEGTVYRLKDINGHDDVSGSGINLAQRVMDCGDSGQILISASIAEALKGTVGCTIHPAVRPTQNQARPTHRNLQSLQFVLWAVDGTQVKVSVDIEAPTIAHY